MKQKETGKKGCAALFFFFFFGGQSQPGSTQYLAFKRAAKRQRCVSLDSKACWKSDDVVQCDWGVRQRIHSGGSMLPTREETLMRYSYEYQCTTPIRILNHEFNHKSRWNNDFRYHCRPSLFAWSMIAQVCSNATSSGWLTLALLCESVQLTNVTTVSRTASEPRPPIAATRFRYPRRLGTSAAKCIPLAFASIAQSASFNARQSSVACAIAGTRSDRTYLVSNVSVRLKSRLHAWRLR